MVITSVREIHVSAFCPLCATLCASLTPSGAATTGGTRHDGIAAGHHFEHSHGRDARPGWCDVSSLGAEGARGPRLAAGARHAARRTVREDPGDAAREGRGRSLHGVLP